MSTETGDGEFAALAVALLACGPPGEALSGLFSSIYATFRIPSGAMLPTVDIGDHFFRDKLADDGSDPDVGDVVALDVARSGAELAPIVR